MEIPFLAQFGATDIDCETSAAAVHLSDLRFYVHDVQLLRPDGSSTDLILDADGIWQQRKIALLDLETSREACLNGTEETNSSVRGTVRAGEYVGIRFTLGVPFELNHADPLLADAPLGDSAMHWHWRSGYKFLRAGIRTADDGFWLHLGSTGCQGTTNNIKSCRAGNRVLVELNDFNPATNQIAVDLSQLILEAELEDGVATDCSSGPAETSCSTAFAALGIDFVTGSITDSQKLFRTKAPF